MFTNVIGFGFFLFCSNTQRVRGILSLRYNYKVETRPTPSGFPGGAYPKVGPRRGDGSKVDSFSSKKDKEGKNK